MANTPSGIRVTGPIINVLWYAYLLLSGFWGVIASIMLTTLTSIFLLTIIKTLIFPLVAYRDNNMNHA